jgi:hypothetical protein
MAKIGNDEMTEIEGKVTEMENEQETDMEKEAEMEEEKEAEMEEKEAEMEEEKVARLEMAPAGSSLFASEALG